MQREYGWWYEGEERFAKTESYVNTNLPLGNSYRRGKEGRGVACKFCFALVIIVVMMIV